MAVFGQDLLLLAATLHWSTAACLTDFRAGRRCRHNDHTTTGWGIYTPQRLGGVIYTTERLDVVGRLGQRRDVSGEVLAGTEISGGGERGVHTISRYTVITRMIVYSDG